MKIYIASKYIKHSQINKEIANLLLENGYEVFLPESIDIYSITKEQMQEVGVRCYQEIECSDVLLVISPYKRSVAAEIGYAIRRKIKEDKIIIVLFRIQDEENDIEDSEAMIVPFIDYSICDYSKGDKEIAYSKLLMCLSQINKYYLDRN